MAQAAAASSSSGNIRQQPGVSAPDAGESADDVAAQLAQDFAAGLAGPRISGDRTSADIILFTEHGKLTYYKKSGLLKATCGNPAHGNCALSRVFRRTENTRKSRLGFCAAWLRKAFDFDTKNPHWATENMPTERECGTAHGLLQRNDDAAAQALLAHEKREFSDVAA